MHYSITISLAEDRRRFCPCGAAAEHGHGLCRKCYARVEWRRRTARPRRRNSRCRRFGRQARDRARALDLAAAMFRTTGKEAGL